MRRITLFLIAVLSGLTVGVGIATKDTVQQDEPAVESADSETVQTAEPIESVEEVTNSLRAIRHRLVVWKAVVEMELQYESLEDKSSPHGLALSRAIDSAKKRLHAME